MLAANTAVATKLMDADITFIRRVHGSPDPIKLKAFSEFADSLGLEVSPNPSRFELRNFCQKSEATIRAGSQLRASPQHEIS